MTSICHLQSNGFSICFWTSFKKDLDNFFPFFFFLIRLYFEPSCLYTYGHVSNALTIKVFKWQFNIFWRLREPTTILEEPCLRWIGSPRQCASSFAHCRNWRWKQEGLSTEGGESWRTGKPRGIWCGEGGGRRPAKPGNALRRAII